MASNSEVGHLKNITNFQDLISFSVGYGPTYNPANVRLKIPQLQAQYLLAETIFNDLKTYKSAFTIATNERRIAFSDFKQLSTRIINAFIVSGADIMAINNAKSINRKIQGYKSTATTIAEQDASTETSINSVSTSQQSYARLLDHLANLIQVLEQNEQYKPNEIDLQVNSLKEKYTDLKAKNTKLVNAYTNYSNAMISRNNSLYNPVHGLVQTAKEVKFYIKSVFGATSYQYKQISGIKFSTAK